MVFYILDTFGNYPALVTDEFGETLEFDSIEQAQNYGNKELQKGFWRVIYG
jgi:hypothetical protein